MSDQPFLAPSEAVHAYQWRDIEYLTAQYGPPTAQWHDRATTFQVWGVGGNDTLMVRTAPLSTTVSWQRNGKPHREGDAPAVIEFDRSGALTCEEWYIDGQRHRTNAPAVKRYFSNGDPQTLAWFNQGAPRDGVYYEMYSTPSHLATSRAAKDGHVIREELYNAQGQLHATDRPASRQFDASGQVVAADYYLDGVKTTKEMCRQRNAADAVIAMEQAEGKDASFFFDADNLKSLYGQSCGVLSNGEMQSYKWWLDGQHTVTWQKDAKGAVEVTWRTNDDKHRDNRPARLSFYSSGELKSEEWYQHGHLHKADGPAHTVYYAHGKPFIESWYLDGRPRVGMSSEIKRVDGSVQAREFYNGIWRERSETYDVTGALHSDGSLPAVVHYDLNQQVVSEQFYNHGVAYDPAQRQITAQAPSMRLPQTARASSAMMMAGGAPQVTRETLTNVSTEERPTTQTAPGLSRPQSLGA